MYGWVVYNVEDSPECGHFVASEEEAIRECEENEYLTYCFVDWRRW